MNVINLDEIYLKTDKGSRRTLKSLVESNINKLYKKGKISDEDYKGLGGSKNYSNSSYHKIYESSTFSYNTPIVCHSCKKTNNERLTPNKPGIVCFVSITENNSSYNIRTSCSKCNNTKNSYINIETLPQNIRTQIKNEESKIKKI